MLRLWLVGGPWDDLAHALGSLAEAGKVSVMDPRCMASEETSALLHPDIVLVRPGAPNAQTTGLKDRNDLSSPAVLACLTQRELEDGAELAPADDILIIPCSTAELETRLHLLTERRRPSGEPQMLSVGDVTMDMLSQRVMVRGAPMALARLEMRLLRFLMENRGRVFRRADLLAAVWKDQKSVGERTVDVHIRRLRQRLGASAERLIHTVKNVGYGVWESPSEG